MTLCSRKPEKPELKFDVYKGRNQRDARLPVFVFLNAIGAPMGVIGAIKSLEHLRGVVSHIGGHVLPLPVSVANVQEIFTRAGVCTDSVVEARIRSTGTMLIDYLKQSVCPRITLEKLLREGKAA